MRKTEQFVGMYDLSKTLRFKAIPVGKTAENIAIRRLIEEDEQRASDYVLVKEVIDDYHRDYIDRKLQGVKLQGLREYLELYTKSGKSEKDSAMLEKMEANLRKQIHASLSSGEEFKKLFGAELIEELLPQYVHDEDILTAVNSFAGFSTALAGFNKTRENIYSAEDISVGIAYRCINENLPKFISNMRCFEQIKSSLGTEILDKLMHDLGEGSFSFSDLFSIDFFDFVLTQKGIEFYNLILSGYVKDNGEKVKGLNEYINLFNQQMDKKAKKLPQLKMLFKQILSEKQTYSFVQERFTTDQELIDSVYTAFAGENGILENCSRIKSLFADITMFNAEGIYYKNGTALSSLSNGFLGDWNAIRSAWGREYDTINQREKARNLEKFDEKKDKAFKGIKAFSAAIIQELVEKYTAFSGIDIPTEDILSYFAGLVIALCDNISNFYNAAEERLSKDYSEEKVLAKNQSYIDMLKSLLDAVKELEITVKAIECKEGDAKDQCFYGEFENLLADLQTVDHLYNMVRNYVTKKPYSTDKVKLYFQNPQLLGGWDKNKVADYRSTLLRKGGKYYLAIIDKSDSKIMRKVPEADTAYYYERLNYKLLPGPSKMLPKVCFSAKNADLLSPSKRIEAIRDRGSFKKGDTFNKDDLCELIDFYKECLVKYPEWAKEFHFDLKPTEEYRDISEFYHDVERQGYKLSFDKVDGTVIDQLVECGSLYLFQLYSKDFSEHSHGRKNLHTLYFEQLFSPENLSDIIFKLNGEAELFFRRASISKADRIIHPANQDVANKNKLNPKRVSRFEYDLIKDKRYTMDQYEFHVPITINWCPEKASRMNDKLRLLLKADENPYVIGIDRGERNLLYVCVIDSYGNIVEQMSLNEIINEYQGITISTDYHSLLEAKERERLAARQSWTTIENIKELKEGYISQVVHKICELIVKYDAIVALENLNMGFKNSRAKVERQVYQKFEKMLIDKLNYLADKSLTATEIGGVLKGYQLTNKFESFEKMSSQNGFLFYVPAWMTSKIDPITGFADLLKPKYTSVNEARTWISKFDSITYDSKRKMFAFSFDYRHFDRTEAMFKKEWVIYSNGDRIRAFRNAAKNNMWDYEEVVLTEAFAKLFSDYGIDYQAGELKECITSIDSKDFYVRFLSLMKLTLQMRNSISGNVEVDYLISPVMNAEGEFYDSRRYAENNDVTRPQNADANGAYNIARKALWIIEMIKQADNESVGKVKTAMKNSEWLEYAQKQ